MSRFSLSALALFFVLNGDLYADWLFSPRLTGIGTYTDNLFLSVPGTEESDFVLQINPGFSLQNTSSRLNATINYDMQNLFYANHSESNSTNHQLDGELTFEIWKDNFFLDANGLINQAIIDPQINAGADNISITDDLTDVYAFSVSPYWVSNLGGYADILARYSYNIVRYDKGVNNSNSQTININLVSGRNFNALNWQLDYYRETIDENGNNTDQIENVGQNDRESFLGTISYPLTNTFSINGRAGYEDNQVDDSIDSENGSFWSLGTTWEPSRYISTTLFYGPDDQEIIVQLNPSSRTSFLISRRDRSVGLDTGVVWSGTFDHRTRYSTWSATYTDSTINGNSIILDNQLITCSSVAGSSIIADNLDSTPVFNSGLPLTSGDFRRKRFQGTVAYARARTNASLNGYIEKRDFSSGEEEKGYGVGADWSRRFGSKTLLAASTCWQQNEFNIDQETRFWSFQTALTHAFTRKLNGAVAYRYARQDSSESTFDYSENRIFLLLQLQF